MKYTAIAAALLMATAALSQSSIKLVSPNGGETLTAGQETVVSWIKTGAEADTAEVIINYSFDNGATWIMLGKSMSASSSKYIIPVRKQPTSKALIKLGLLGYYGMLDAYDTSDGTFTVQPTSADIYEPNNDFSNAYPIAVGDSVVRNAVVVMDWEAATDDDVFRSINIQQAFDVSSYCTDTARLDVDVYKVSLTAGKLATISVFPCMPIIRDGNGICQNMPIVALFDESGNLIPKAGLAGNVYGMNTSFDIVKSGVYYCKVFPEYKGSWSVYGLSVNSAISLSSKTYTVDTATVYKNGETYKIELSSDTGSLQLNLTFNKKIAGSITTAILSPDELPSAANTQAKVKAISVSTSDTAFSSSITAADIVIPYSLANLNGYSEKSLVVYCLNDRTNEWTPVESTIDTVNKKITAHTSHFSIYGVFISAPTAVSPAKQNNKVFYGIKAETVAGKRSIALHFSMAQAANARIMIYDLKGKCMKKVSNIPVAQGNSISMLNVGNFTNGKYLLSITAAGCQMKQTVLIMN